MAYHIIAFGIMDFIHENDLTFFFYLPTQKMPFNTEDVKELAQLIDKRLEVGGRNPCQGGVVNLHPLEAATSVHLEGYSSRQMTKHPLSASYLNTPLGLIVLCNQIFGDST